MANEKPTEAAGKRWSAYVGFSMFRKMDPPAAFAVGVSYHRLKIEGVIALEAILTHPEVTAAHDAFQAVFAKHASEAGMEAASLTGADLTQIAKIADWREKTRKK